MWNHTKTAESKQIKSQTNRSRVTSLILNIICACPTLILESPLCQQRKEQAGSLPVLLSVRFHPLDRLRI